jgi:hypothetical protein
VVADMREGRFGIDDQPKYWVKKAVELETGELRILKLVFHEEFTTRMESDSLAAAFDSAWTPTTEGSRAITSKPHRAK